MIGKVFRQNAFDYVLPAPALSMEDLASEKTWQVLELTV
jgi:hypothetical protein